MSEERRPFIFHKTLVESSPTRITVDGPPRKVAALKKARFGLVDITVHSKSEGDTEMSYWCENAECRDFFNGKRGQTFTITAEGNKEEAVIIYVGESGNRQADPPQQQQRGGRQQQRPPANGKPPVDRVFQAKVFMARRVSLMKITLRATLKLVEDAKAGGHEMTPEMVQAVNSSLFITADRAGIGDALPLNIDFKTLEVVRKEEPKAKGKKKEEKKPEPEKPKCPVCGTELSEDQSCSNQECETNKMDDVPF